MFPDNPIALLQQSFELSDPPTSMIFFRVGKAKVDLDAVRQRRRPGGSAADKEMERARLLNDLFCCLARPERPLFTRPDCCCRCVVGSRQPYSTHYRLERVCSGVGGGSGSSVAG